MVVPTAVLLLLLLHFCGRHKTATFRTLSHWYQDSIVTAEQS
jgi:hypothetical protein